MTMLEVELGITLNGNKTLFTKTLCHAESISNHGQTIRTGLTKQDTADEYVEQADAYVTIRVPEGQ